MIDELLKRLKEAKKVNGELHAAFIGVADQCHADGNREARNYYLDRAFELIDVIQGIDNEIRKLEES